MDNKKIIVNFELIFPLNSNVNDILVGSIAESTSKQMSLNSKKVVGIRVLDIAEEGATAIENMVNKVIQELDKHETPIIDLQVTETNCFLILGEKKPD